MSFLSCRVRGPVLAVATVASLAAGCGSGSSETPSATLDPTLSTQPVPSTTTTSTAPSLTSEQEVEQAYLRSWDVLADALYRLDPSGLEEAFAGEQLAKTRSMVEGLAQDETPVRVDVEHSYAIAMNGESAVVRDAYLDRSVLLDGSQSAEPVNVERITEDYVMERTPAGWHVVRIIRS